MGGWRSPFAFGRELHNGETEELATPSAGSRLVESTHFTSDPILRKGTWYFFTTTTLRDRSAPSSPGSPGSYNGPWHHGLLAVDAHTGKRLWAKPLASGGVFGRAAALHFLQPWASDSALLVRRPYETSGLGSSSWLFGVADIQADGGLLFREIEGEGPVHESAKLAWEIEPGLALYAWEHSNDRGKQQAGCSSGPLVDAANETKRQILISGRRLPP